MTRIQTPSGRGSFSFLRHIPQADGSSRLVLRTRTMMVGGIWNVFHSIDFTKFGVLFLNGGNWQGNQVVTRVWVGGSTHPFLPENYATYYSPYFDSLPGQGYYNLMWWGFVRPGSTYAKSARMKGT